MAKPQQPELARSGRSAVDPHHDATVADVAPTPSPAGAVGPVPPENEPGHRPAHDQDKPDPAAMAERLGTTDAGRERRGRRDDSSVRGRVGTGVNLAVGATSVAVRAAGSVAGSVVRTAERQVRRVGSRRSRD